MKFPVAFKTESIQVSVLHMERKEPPYIDIVECVAVSKEEYEAFFAAEVDRAHQEAIDHEAFVDAINGAPE